MIRQEIAEKNNRDAASYGLTEQQMLLAKQLQAKHGRIKVTRERSGLHFYMPSPIALQKDGEAELYKLHLAVNVDKFEKGIHWCGVCHKYDQQYSMEMLLTYPSLIQRGVNLEFVEITGTAVRDGSPPPHPGETILLTDLYKRNPNHAVFEYLKRRKFFNLKQLVQQFKASYCYESNPEIKVRGFHKTGFITEPAGRIIFFISEFGKDVGWQGRTLDFWQDGVQYMWFEKDRQWVGVRELLPNGDEVEIAPFINLHVVRYYLPVNSTPSAHLMGYDAAVKYNKGKGLRWFGICEGPFDAARLGPPFCAVMGKHFNEVRANLVFRANVDKVFVICDNDAAENNRDAGSVLWKDCSKHLGVALNMPLYRIRLPEDVKDLGDMEEKEAKQLVRNFLANHNIEF